MIISLFSDGIAVREYAPLKWDKLYRIAFSWCHDPDFAADLVQETLSRALRSRERFPNEKAMEVWLFRIMNNCRHDHYRRYRETVDIDEMELVDAKTVEDEYHTAHTLERVRIAVAGLSEKYRRVFTLIAIEGLSYEAVADILDIPVGTVMSRLCRARQQLKTQLGDLVQATDARVVPLRRKK